MREKLAAIFKDKNGHIVIWQMPNFLLWVWIALKVVTTVVAGGKLKTGLDQLSGAVLFAWAYFETTQGASHFRKILGVVIMLVVIIGFFL